MSAANQLINNAGRGGGGKGGGGRGGGGSGGNRGGGGGRGGNNAALTKLVKGLYEEKDKEKERKEKQKASDLRVLLDARPKNLQIRTISDEELDYSNPLVAEVYSRLTNNASLINYNLNDSAWIDRVQITKDLEYAIENLYDSQREFETAFSKHRGAFSNALTVFENAANRLKADNKKRQDDYELLMDSLEGISTIIKTINREGKEAKDAVIRKAVNLKTIDGNQCTSAPYIDITTGSPVCEANKNYVESGFFGSREIKTKRVIENISKEDFDKYNETKSLFDKTRRGGALANTSLGIIVKEISNENKYALLKPKIIMAYPVGSNNPEKIPIPIGTILIPDNIGGIGTLSAYSSDNINNKQYTFKLDMSKIDQNENLVYFIKQYDLDRDRLKNARVNVSIDDVVEYIDI